MNHYFRQHCAPLLRAFLCASLAVTPAAAAIQGDAAIPSASPGGVYWQVTVPNDGVSLRVSMPDGSVVEQEHPRGQAPWFAAGAGGTLPDGNYVYEMVIAPVVSPLARAQALSSRESGKPVTLPSGIVQSGVFQVVGGVVVLPDPSIVETRAPATQTKTMRPKDVVTPDDQIVQGSLCVGLDCVNNESFGFDTIRLKENNTRIKFEDTSVGTFPTTDWQLTANDTASGGASKFSIEDITGARVPFTLTAGAATNSIFVDSTGRVGLRTAVPVLDLHISTSNTPATRLEQTSAGGFTAQTWDIGGNEANFFVRDVTGGSRLPFRIRPGAPTSSIDIAANGFVGIGTASPGGPLHIGGVATADIFAGMGPNLATGPALNFGYAGQSFGRGAGFFNVRPDALATSPNPSLRFMTQNVERMIVTDLGNVGIGTSAPTNPLQFASGALVTAGGVFTNASSRSYKESIRELTASDARAAFLQLSPVTYVYKVAPDEHHVGFIAEDSPAILTTLDRKAMSPMDVTAVLTKVIQEQQKTIEALSARIAKLELER